MKYRWLLVLLFVVSCGDSSRPGNARNQVDPALEREIAGIKAIDNHAHPSPNLAENEADTTIDPLDQADFESFPMPARARPDNPEFIAAWRALYGYSFNDMAPEHLSQLRQMKQRAIQDLGENYPASILDKLSIDVMITNRVVMGPGLNPARFRFVPYVDALLLPLNNSDVADKNPDHRGYYVGIDRVLTRWVSDLGLKSRPDTLEAYLAQVVIPVLDGLKQRGVFAVKFEAAYFRPLRFDDTPRSEAENLYARYIKGGQPTIQEYRALQDFLFRTVAREAGNRGMAVHFHTGAGAGSYYDLAGGSPTQLDSVFNDKTLRKTNFVLIHGGWPFTNETAYLLTKPNVYADFSYESFFLSKSQLGRVLQTWLTIAPEKVLFGTDAFGTTPEIGWEEMAWLTSTTGRHALALALTEMMSDEGLSRERALQIARMVLRENAMGLYGWKDSDIQAADGHKTK